jgi:hypothetical protein
MIDLKKLTLYVAMATLMMGAAKTAQATIFTLNDDASGYLSSGGNSTGIRPDTNYLVGLCDANDCKSSPGTYSDYFYFVVPTLDGPITSVSLLLPTGSTTLNQSPSLTVQFTSIGITEENLGIQNFPNLGAGTSYGSYTYTSADNGVTDSISLNAAAMSDLGNGGITFGISGASSLNSTDINAPDQLVYGRTQHDVSQLIITTSAVPLPPALSMLLLGFAGLRFAGFRGAKNGPAAG